MTRIRDEKVRASRKWKRSLAKSITYRCVIMVLDFVVISFFTGSVKTALGFIVVSNIYTTVAYYFHERIWNRIQWGTERYKGLK